MATAKSKTTKPAFDPAKRNATMEHNANFKIDFSAGRSLDDIATRKATRQSIWSGRLAELKAAVLNGEAEAGTAYKVGEFLNAQGANNVAKTFEKRPERLPLGGTFLLEGVTNRGSEFDSELWASFTPDDDGAEYEADEDEYADEDEG